VSDDGLRELAENRGYKLVASRIRTPGKGDFGRFGLKDHTGRKLLGFGEKGLTATPDEIEAFLRGNGSATWKGSVGSIKRKAKSKPDPASAPEPVLTIRPAGAKDAEAIAALIAELGYEVSASEVRKRLRLVDTLVADKSGVVGVLTMSLTQVLHRPKPVGRISMLTVAGHARSGGIGALLVAAAEARLGAKGCGLVEVTSNRKRLRAHNFYERLGYERTSFRFAKTLPE
jgi:ribosomal protein S18 acetylase RimI-like enzyme